MKRIITVVAVAALMAVMLVAIAAPAFALGQTNPSSCGIGTNVSFDADRLGGIANLPEYNYYPGAENLGQHLHAFQEDSKAGCQGNA